MRAPLALPLVLSVLLGACAPKAPPPPPPSPPRVEETYAQLAQDARDDARNRALIELRRAALALNHGDPDEAESALRGAASVMQDFRADGELRALVGTEDRKEWKGEPHEKVAAFTLLGALLHAEGDRGNAMAMYRSAVLADAGTALDRYRSDVVTPRVLRALAHQAEGEDAAAETAMNAAVDALWARHWQPILTEALAACTESADACAARSALYTALSPALAASPRDPAGAVDAAVSMASDLLLQAQNLPRDDRPGTLSAFRKRQLRRAGPLLAAEASGWRERLGPVLARPVADPAPRALSRTPVAVAAPVDGPPAAGEDAPPLALPAHAAPPVVLRGDAPLDRDADPARLQAVLEGLLQAPPDTVLLLPHGRGPQKVALGRFDEALTYTDARRGLRAPALTLGAAGSAAALPLDSMTWQARSRGGRRVDAVLRGKAIYKQSAADVGKVLLYSALVAHDVDRDSPLAPVLAIVGGISLLTGAVVTPEADTRGWEDIPEALILVVGRLGPGAHTLTVDGRTTTLEVPADGQLVGVLPWRPPWGRDVLGTRVD